jgi:hypothetical protein
MVMVPPDGMVVNGVKTRVAVTEDLPTTRSEAAMIKDTEAREKMLPDDT